MNPRSKILLTPELLNQAASLLSNKSNYSEVDVKIQNIAKRIDRIHQIYELHLALEDSEILNGINANNDLINKSILKLITKNPLFISDFLTKIKNRAVLNSLKSLVTSQETGESSSGHYFPRHPCKEILSLLEVLIEDFNKHENEQATIALQTFENLIETKNIDALINYLKLANENTRNIIYTFLCKPFRQKNQAEQKFLNKLIELLISDSNFNQAFITFVDNTKILNLLISLFNSALSTHSSNPEIPIRITMARQKLLELTRAKQLDIQKKSQNLSVLFIKQKEKEMEKLSNIQESFEEALKAPDTFVLQEILESPTLTKAIIQKLADDSHWALLILRIMFNKKNSSEFDACLKLFTSADTLLNFISDLLKGNVLKGQKKLRLLVLRWEQINGRSLQLEDIPLFKTQKLSAQNTSYFLSLLRSEPLKTDLVFFHKPALASSTLQDPILIDFEKAVRTYHSSQTELVSFLYSPEKLKIIQSALKEDAKWCKDILTLLFNKSTRTYFLNFLPLITNKKILKEFIDEKNSNQSISQNSGKYQDLTEWFEELSKRDKTLDPITFANQNLYQATPFNLIPVKRVESSPSFSSESDSLSWLNRISTETPKTQIDSKGSSLLVPITTEQPVENRGQKRNFSSLSAPRFSTSNFNIEDSNRVPPFESICDQSFFAPSGEDTNKEELDFNLNDVDFLDTPDIFELPQKFPRRQMD